jgi:hypothetical protein
VTSTATLYEQVFQITRGDLEHAEFSPFVLPEELKRLDPVRVVRIAEFWKRADGEDTGALDRAMEEFVGGLHGQRTCWALLLRGLPTEIQCWLALDLKAGQSMLRGNFADIRLSSEHPDWQIAKPLPNAVYITGTPSLGPEDRPRSDGLEKLCRGLLGATWSYLVVANPRTSAQTIQSINQIAERIRDVRANHLLKGSPLDEENRTAQRCVELLEAKLQRFERGRVSGMWEARCVLSAGDPAALSIGRQALQSAFGGEESLPDPIRVCPCDATVSQDPPLESVTSGELAALTRLLKEDFPGYELLEPARFGVEPSGPSSGGISVGEILDRGAGTGNWVRIPRQDLTKHGLVAGITGSGKTNSCFWLLDQVWDGGKGRPFLVIESAKSEYRALAGHPRFRGVRVFTVADETVSPLRLKPFEVPQGMLVQTHIDYLKSLFAAAFVLYPPMPYVLEQSVQEIYQDRGWDVARNTNFRGNNSPRSYPSLADLAAKIPVIVDRMGYEQRIAMDVKAGLLARINQLRLGGGKGLMLDTRRSIAASVLFDSPCILELKRMVSDEEKAFVIGLLLVRLYEHRETAAQRPEGLVHLTLIEEAHRLLRNVSTEQGSDVSANPKGKAIETFANLLSEIRAYGEGIVVAEQIPTKLAPDIVKNSGFKLVHRLVSPEDRELMGRAINLTEPQVRKLASLETGMAVTWTEQTLKATLVRVPLAPAKDAPNMTDEQIRLQVAGRQTDGLLLAHASCSACPALSVRGCSPQVQGELDGPLRDSFRRVFNALRLNASKLTGAYQEFRQLTKRRSAAVPIPSVCTFVALAEPELERRGEFRGWQHADVEQIITFACETIRAMDSAFDRREALVPAPEPLRAFQERCRQLETPDVLPFPGCGLCDSPCLFRFDMSHADKTNGAEFRSAFHDPKSKTDRLLEIAHQAAGKSIFISDHTSVTGGAYCFAVQQLSTPSMNLALYYQQEMAGMLKRRLIPEKEK